MHVSDLEKQLAERNSVEAHWADSFVQLHKFSATTEQPRCRVTIWSRPCRNHISSSRPFWPPSPQGLPEDNWPCPAKLHAEGRGFDRFLGLRKMAVPCSAVSRETCAINHTRGTCFSEARGAFSCPPREAWNFSYLACTRYIEEENCRLPVFIMVLWY